NNHEELVQCHILCHIWGYELNVYELMMDRYLALFSMDNNWLLKNFTTNEDECLSTPISRSISSIQHRFFAQKLSCYLKKDHAKKATNDDEESEGGQGGKFVAWHKMINAICGPGEVEKEDSLVHL
ncbi:hypothetical protein ACJX0J_037374, partial [Zea mays]